MNVLKGIHRCEFDHFGDWRINSNSYILNLKNLKEYLTEDKLKLVSFKDIAWKGKNMDPRLISKRRYDKCDIKFPGIITEYQNPYDCKYRIVDGLHRISKMVNMGMKRNYFYIIDSKLYTALLETSNNRQMQRNVV